MRKLTRKLFISILAAVFAVVALGTSTFAWITISNTASVNAFEGTVEAGSAGIELNTTDGDTGWTNALTIANIPGFDKFSDITSSDGKTFNKITITENAAAATTPVEGTANYMEFVIYVRNSNKNAKGTLNVFVEDAKVSFATIGNDGVFNSDIDGTAKSGIKVSNAARMSISTGETGESFVTAYQQKTEESSGEFNSQGFSTDGFAWQYLIKKGFKPYKNPGEPGNLPKVDPLPTLVATRSAGDAGKVQVLTLDGHIAQKLTIRIWIEGYDNECHHNILNQKLSIAFAFSSVDPNKK